MTKCDFDKRERFGIRKFTIGACSVLIGATLFGTQVSADQLENVDSLSEPAVELSSVGNEHLEKTEAEEGISSISADEKAVAEELNGEASVSDSREEKLPSTPSDNPENKLEDTEEAEDKEVDSSDSGLLLSDFPQVEDQGIRPKEIKFDNWDQVLAWEPGARPDDDLNRASVELVERFRGHVVNERANENAKVEALSNTNSKAKDHASVGGEEFKAYAFDYWQYIDSMVFWEGLIPSPDVIDAGHRNGVPVLGTIFYNWSSSIEDQEKFVASMRQDPDGSFPVARKLVDMAKYYGFDGYFINQETTGSMVQPLGETMRNFMLYTKEYAESIGYPITYSWYDAMTYEYGRYHEDGLGEYNYPFMEKEGDKVPADRFFANFNWTRAKNNYSIEVAKRIGRDPFDIFAGFELQRGGSYKTQINWDALFDENGKLKLSLGLFAPDTITSLGATGEDYHENENIFFTGYQGDPTKQKPSDKNWYGLANLIADKTAITSSNFNSSFNTGHGKKWFVDGKVAKDGEWNYRSVSGILPTWRWWIEASGEKLAAAYDFDDAYNGGNSLRFTGDLEKNGKQEVKLYSTKIPLSETSRLRVAHKGGQGANISLALALEPDYQFANKEAWRLLKLSGDWQDQTFDLSSLAGKTVYGIQVVIENEAALSDFDFRLGQLAIYDQETSPTAPKDGQVLAKRLKNAQDAEAVISFTGTDDADYYEVYAQVDGQWKLLTGSSNTRIYLPQLVRSAQAEGRTQALKVHAVGKNGLRSEAGEFIFDWEMTVKDTSLPKPLAENIVLGAEVIGSSFAKKEGGEGIEGMLNGTITSLSDKWSSHQLSGHVDIRLTQPRTVVRWAMDHAGAGGESVNDGLMNTKDFDLYYKNENGDWVLAKEVRGNRDHVTDIVLDKPIRAQEWRLDVLTSDNGTPWKAIRIYNWRMYEELDMETPNIPMTHAVARHLGNHQIQVGFKDVPANRKIALYSSPDTVKPLAELESTESGNLIFDPIRFESLPEFIYYRTLEEGKDWSNLLAIRVPQGEKVVKAMEWIAPLEKKVYRQGSPLSLAGAQFRVAFEGDWPAERVNTTNPAVTVRGYDPQKLGEQTLTVSYLGETLAQPLTVYVVEDIAQGEKKAVGLEIQQLPKVQYVVGDDLDVTNGRFAIIYDDESTQSFSLTEAGVEIVGFDSRKEGRQSLGLRYAGLETSFDVLVSPKPIVNDEYLKQKIAEIEALQTQAAYLYSSEQTKLTLQTALEEAKSVVADTNRTVEQVEAAQTLLEKQLGELDGEKLYQADLGLLNQLIQEVKGIDTPINSSELSSLLEKTEKILGSDSIRPDEMKELLNEWTDLFEQSSLVTHVGTRDSMESKNLLAPEKPRMDLTYELVPRQVIKRTSTDLPLGKERIVQEGADGQMMVAHLVYSDGRRELYSRTVANESQPKIVEVGSSLPIQQEKTLMVENSPQVEKQIRDASLQKSGLPQTGDTYQEKYVLLGLVGVALAGLSQLAKLRKQGE
ncbi:endo-beta-N-acetylglucosaminidase [Streptococcus suis]|uniref:endo-beta-N-acetylglucosaminidase n=1 Tax=Streptococcus suis TaxID=1307 RepID=UPI003BA0359E